MQDQPSGNCSLLLLPLHMSSSSAGLIARTSHFRYQSPRSSSSSPYNLPLTPKFISIQTPLSSLPSRFENLTFLALKKPISRFNWKLNSSSMAEISRERKESKYEIFETEEILSVSLAKYTADLSEKFVKERGAFTVVVSGGSLIKSLRKLAEEPYVDSINWSKWHVLWVDERVVPKDHPDSNYKLAYDEFLSKVPIPPSQVYAINDALPAEGASDDYETCLVHLVNTNVLALSTEKGFPKFDLMLLGMGPDGHIASLFPGHPLCNENHRWVAFIKDSPKPPPERITLTFPVINSSSYIAMVVAGAGKSNIVGKALGKEVTSNLLPVEMVSPEEEMIWFLDKEAASKL